MADVAVSCASPCSCGSRGRLPSISKHQAAGDGWAHGDATGPPPTLAVSGSASDRADRERAQSGVARSTACRRTPKRCRPDAGFLKRPSCAASPRPRSPTAATATPFPSAKPRRAAARVPDLTSPARFDRMATTKALFQTGFTVRMPGRLKGDFFFQFHGSHRSRTPHRERGCRMSHGASKSFCDDEQSQLPYPYFTMPPCRGRR